MTGYTRKGPNVFHGDWVPFIGQSPGIMRNLLFSLVLIGLMPCFLSAQSLQLGEIMNGESFVGFLPEQVTWSPDSETILFSWNPEKELIRQSYSWHSDRGIQKRSIDDIRDIPGSSWTWSASHARAVTSWQGDIYIWDHSTRSFRQLTSTTERESDPFFGKSDSEIGYAAGQNLYLLDLTKGTITQLTDLRKGNKKQDSHPSNQDRWLEQDQMQLSAILQSRNATELAQKELDEQIKPKRPRSIYVGDDRISGLSAGPSLRFFTWSQVHAASPKATEVPAYVTKSGYTADLQARPKVGHDQDLVTFHCYDRQRDTIYQIVIDSLPGIYQKPAFQAIYHTDSIPWNPVRRTPKPVIFHGPVWSAQGLALLDIKSLDHKDRWVAVYDPSVNKLLVIDHQHDDCWIGGPGIVSWTEMGGQMGWLDHGRAVWFLSEQTGYAHVYSHHLDSDRQTALTQGEFEVLDVQLSRDEKTFFLRANAEGPAEQHVYHLPASGGQLVRITDRPGNYEMVVSPDEKRLAIRYSFANLPWELYEMPNRAGAKMTRITQSTTAQFNAYNWRIPEIIHVPADDGVKVPARIYRPSNPNGAAVIFVHGAGYLQNVHNWWSSYYREYMFHNLLCDEGYTVLDMDYRASSGYGRDWRTAIYRHMGGRDLTDQVDGALFLVDSIGIDKDRIGIYGGSYGGFITLMALFKHPGTFACGAALRSVTDWAHYNDPYTANILNTPVEDSIAYRQSSPIYYAEGLVDPLVMLHGMVDVNVQFQDVVRLSQRLIELGKTDWELAVFPLEDHGFVEASSWKDEYRRIYELFRKHLSHPAH